MKLALVVGIYGRHDLEEIALNSYRRQSKKYGFDIIVAGSEGEKSRKLAKGCHYIEIENRPVSNKYNATINKAKELDVDGVVLMGSDDFVSDSYWDWIYSIEDDGFVYGLKDIYFLSIRNKALYYFNGYNKKASVGAGRYFPKSVLEAMNWKLWSDGVNKGMDGNCDTLLKYKGINHKVKSMNEVGCFLCDVKHTKNITDHNVVVRICKEVDYSLIYEIEEAEDLINL